jgi:hypothetical protein
MKPLVAVGLAFVLIAEAAMTTGRIRAGSVARDIMSSVHRGSAAAVSKSFATTVRAWRGASLSANRVATTKVVGPTTFRAAAIALFVAALLLGDLVGPTSAHMTSAPDQFLPAHDGAPS